MHTHIRFSKILVVAFIFGFTVSAIMGIVAYRNYVHAMACYADSTCSTDSDGTLTTNGTAVPAGTCATPVGVTVNGVAQTSGSFSGFTYQMMKVKASGTTVAINKSWVGDNTDQWLLLTCASAGTPLSYSVMATTIPSGYYLNQIPTLSGGGTCTYPVTNGCSLQNNSGSCWAGYANAPASMFTKKSQTTAPCITGTNFSLCSYGTVNVSANITGGSWTVTGPFDQNPASYNGLPISNYVVSGSGTASSWTNARAGSYSISVTPPSGYTYTVSPSATQTVSCAAGQSITFSITFNSTTCSASGICPSTANGGTCSGYTASSAIYATLCSSKYTTATCNNGTWSGTVPTYSSCTQYCATSGACSGYSSGQVCSGYSNSSAVGPTLCSAYALSATCQSNGTWSGTTPTYSSCSQYCPVSGVCSQTISGGTCNGYSISSATYPTLCSTNTQSVTCQSNGAWSGTTPTYSSCTQSCGVSGACPVTQSGGTCTSYASSTPLTTCSAINSTCQSGGTWSPTPGSYSSCSNPCAASGGCPTTASGGSCTSYSSNSAIGPNTCSTYARTSTCNNGSWSLAPYTYSSCSQTCSTGSVSLSPSTITAQGTTALSPPASWTGGTFGSSNTTIMTVSGSTGTGNFAGTASITGSGWTDSYGATNCPLSGSTATVLGTYTCTPSLSVTVGGTGQEYGYYDADGSGTATTTQTVTSGPAWSSNNTGIATISSSGLVTGVAAGNVNMVSVYQGVTATCPVVVNSPKSCTVTASPNLIVSGSASSLSWSSTGVAACTWTSGLSGSAGTSGSQSVNPSVSTTYALNCDSGAATCSFPLKVCQSGTVVANPTTATVGKTTALSIPSGWSGSGTFSSSNSGVLSVSGSTGTGVAAGSATVSGSNWTDPNGTTGCPLSGVAVTVVTCPAGSVTATPSTINSGLTTALTQPASWTGGTFSSSNTGVLTVSGSTGTGVAAGTATVTGTNWTAPNLATGCSLSGATVNVVTCPASTITLTPATLTAQGTTAISSTVAMTGGTFSSSNTTVMTISGSTGTGKFAGTSTISGSGWTAANGATNCPITGTTATVLGTYTIDTPLTVTAGGTLQDHGYYDADGSGVATTTQTVTSGPTWTSSNTSVATISASGLITGVAAGTVTITSVYQGVTATGSVTVVACPASTITLTPATLTAQGTTAISSTVAMTGGTFSSSNTTVMTISGSTGTGKFAGTSTISGSGWTAANGATNCPITGTTATVNGTYTTDPSKGAVISGTAQFSGYYDADGSGVATTTQTITSGATWLSSNTAVATISASGLATCVSAGSSTITSRYTQPANSVMLTATGTMNCSTAPTCTVTSSPSLIVSGNSSSLSWSSSGVAACTWTSGLSGSAGTSGSQSVSPATSTTYALNCDSGVATCSGTVTVIPPCPTGYAVTATPNSIATNGTTTLSAPAGWTGGTFSSNNTGVLTVSGSTGTGVGSGTATVTGSGWNVNTGAMNCSLDGAAVTVSQPTLSLNTPVYIGVGKVAQFTGTYTLSGVSNNVSNQSTWSSGNTSVASSLGGGSFSGLSAGSATITANYAAGGVSATGTINVVQCKASDITITLRSGINTPMPNIPVTISTDVGSLTVTSGTTNAQGVIVTSLRGPIPGSVVSSPMVATITATAQGVVLTKTVTFDPASVCYSNQIGMAPTDQTFASLENLFATVFPYVHPSVLMGMVWSGGDER